MSVYAINGTKIADLAGEKRDTAYMKLISGVQGNEGACTDGTYVYSASANNSKVYKFNILTRETTSAIVSANLDHANDMTYNPNTGKLYIATMDLEANIAVINPETLEFEEMIVLYDADGETIHRCYAIAYDRVNDQYITGDSATNGKNYSFFNSSFEYIKTITIDRNESYVIQGIETDGKYIYRILSGNVTQPGWIYIHNMDMTYVGKIELPQVGEPEALAFDWNGNWYSSYNTGYLYYTGIDRIMSFETAEQFDKIVAAYSS